MPIPGVLSEIDDDPVLIRPAVEFRLNEELGVEVLDGNEKTLEKVELVELIVMGTVTVTWTVVSELIPEETLWLLETLTLRALVEIGVPCAVEESDVEERVAIQEQADEIRDGFPEQCETKEGKSVVTVFSAVV